MTNFPLRIILIKIERKIMKKLPLFALIVSSLSFTLFGCNQSSGNSKVYIEFGKVHLESETSVTQMNYEKLKSRIENSESFVMAISRVPGSCTCWADFEPILLKFNKKYNLDIQHINAEALANEANKFGLHTTYGDMPSLAFFRDGVLTRQITYASARDVFKDETLKKLEEVFFENAVLPKMLFIERETLDSYISSNKEFNLYLERNECGDCKSLNSTVLKNWNKTVTSVNDPLYVFDMQPWWVNTRSEETTEEQKKAYQDIKDEYGLSTTNNPDLGYSTGMFPTFQRRQGSTIKDMCVVYNDGCNKDTGVISSYFTITRVNKMSYLAGTGTDYVLDQKIIPLDKAEVWRSKTMHELHDPIANLFLKYYVK